MKTILLASLGFISFQSAQATSCADIRAKAKAPKSGTAPCVLVDHTVGYSRGATISVYKCGGTKYTLTKLENSDCTVTSGEK